MKFLIKILSAVIIAGMFNCSKSENPTISIVGKWTYTSSAKTGCTTSSDNSNYSCSSNCYYYVFTSKTYTFYDSNGTSLGGGTYSISRNKITSTANGSGSVPSTNTIELSGNTMTLISAKNSSTGCVDAAIFVKD